MKFFTQTCLITVVFSSLLFTACQIPDSGAKLISRTANGLAIAGYDTVAYHTIDAAAKGKPEYEYVWGGAKWLFLNAENRDRFAAAPESYAPEYGGFCAWSISENKTMNADPEVWKLIDGKLYLIQSEAVKEIWEKSQADLIEKGNKYWQTINKG